MRADRLVAIVLLLQTRAQMTARDLAERLEAFERTIRRDLDALSFAGVPIYAQRGRNGGWRLLGGHRIDLRGCRGCSTSAPHRGVSAVRRRMRSRLCAAQTKPSETLGSRS